MSIVKNFSCESVIDIVNTCIVIYYLQSCFMCLISFYTHITDEEIEAENNLHQVTWLPSGESKVEPRIDSIPNPMLFSCTTLYCLRGLLWSASQSTYEFSESWFKKYLKKKTDGMCVLLLSNC